MSLRHPQHIVTIDSMVEIALQRAWPMLGRQSRRVLYFALVKGIRNNEIADLMGISIKTVKEHLWQSHLRSGVSSQRQAHAFYAIRYYQEKTREDPIPSWRGRS